MISAYRVMWLVVIFDLPVVESIERRRAVRFRNLLLDEGFIMKQFSVYLKHVESRTKAEAIADRIGKQTPQEGDVSILFFTDKQYSMTRNYAGRKKQDTESKPGQLTLF